MIVYTGRVAHRTAVCKCVKVSVTYSFCNVLTACKNINELHKDEVRALSITVVTK